MARSSDGEKSSRTSGIISDFFSAARTLSADLADSFSAIWSGDKTGAPADGASCVTHRRAK